MEVEVMLRQPELLDGLGDLLADPEPAVVKRTIRVFANVYRHAVTSLATGDLDEATFRAAWPSVKGVAEQLMHMLGNAENEGVTIHIVRFLEAALVAHLVSDVSHHPEISLQGSALVSKGISCLTDLLTTPYVGGSSFIVAMRAIITVACYKPDVRDEVVLLIEKQISSPPPTLFDHNVRSLNKILQRNLFRILRRATSLSLRSRLVEMMVTVGVQRRLLHQWAPPQEGRKRPAQMPNSDDIISGRNSPPTKKTRFENVSDDEGRVTPPRDPREIKLPKDNRELRDPRLVKESQMIGESMGPKDPRTSAQLVESIKSSLPNTKSLPSQASSSPHGTPPQRHSPPLDSQLPLNDKLPSKQNSPSTSGRSTPEISQENTLKAIKTASSNNFEFLKNLITSTKESTAARPFLQKCTDKERALYERLDHPSVVEVVLHCLNSVPDSPPDLLSKLGYSGNDVNGIREHLTRTLAPHITEKFINSLTPPHESSSVLLVTNPANLSRPSSTSSASTAFSSRSSPPPSNHRESSPPSPPSSSRSTPTDHSQVCVSDVDLREYLDKGFHNSGDIDMRTSGPHKSFRDPRNMRMDSITSRTDPRPNSRNSPVDPRLSCAESKAVTSNPRVTTQAKSSPAVTHSSLLNSRNPMNNPSTSGSDNSCQRGLVNHTLRPPQPFSDARDPRMTIPPPNLIMNTNSNFNTNHNFNNGCNFGPPDMGVDPRMEMMNGPFDPNFGNKYCGRNYQDPRMGSGLANMNYTKAPPPLGNGPLHFNNRLGPMHMSEPRFMGSPGIFNQPPRPNHSMNNGPWQNMPMHNNGQGLFSQAPPMHL